MSLETRIIALAQAIGTDVKDLRLKQGDLTSLSTAAKNNLVAAINELNTAVGNTLKINDAAINGDTTVTWSADKIFDTIEAAKANVKNELVNGAAAALDTLSELASALGNDANFAASIATELGNRVRYDSAQNLTAAQKLQACTNMGIGDPESDFSATYTAAKA